MKVGRKYCAPVVLKEVSVDFEADFLAGSTVNKQTEVKTVGQEVVTMDFSQTSFNQEWDK